MKKLLTLTIAALFMAMSGTSPAKEPICDSDLAAMTAEAGVTINLDDFSTGSLSIGVTSWGDGDGLATAGYGSAGYVGMTGLGMTGDVASFSGDMKVDVGSNATQTRVNIALPTLTLGSTNVSSVMKIGAAQNLSGAKTMGTLDMVGLRAEITGSMQVYAH
jgi:PPE-repeat protein